MVKIIREKLIAKFWNEYKKCIPFYDSLFPQQNTHLDHLAIIDLPSRNSGIEFLSQVFSCLGFEVKGEGYLPEKQNPFIWMREEAFDQQEVSLTLPQLVLADFKLEELSCGVRKITEKYANFYDNADVSELSNILDLIRKSTHEELDSKSNEIVESIYKILFRQNIAKPTLKEFLSVKEENELVAWVLAWGRKINHFGISIHLLEGYKNLKEFNSYANKFIELNDTPSLIKGNAECGIEQSSTKGSPTIVRLHDGEVELPDSFLEFVWRFPINNNRSLAKDFYHDFIPQNANYVVESIYSGKNTSLKTRL